MKTIALTAEQEVLLRKEWPRESMTTAEICSAIGYSQRTIRRFANEFKLGHRPTAPGLWGDAQADEIVKLYKDGVGPAEIGRRFNMTRNQVTSKLSRIGALRRRTAPPPPVRGAAKVREAAAPVKPLRAPDVKQAPPNPLGCKISVIARGAAPPAAPERPKPMRAHPNARTIADLEPAQCRWPVGADPGPGNGHLQLFCAEPRDLGETYCPACRSRAWLSSRTPEQRAFDAARAAKMRAAKGRAHGVNSWFFPNSGEAA